MTSSMSMPTTRLATLNQSTSGRAPGIGLGRICKRFECVADAARIGFSVNAIYRSLRDGTIRQGYCWEYA